MTTRPVENIYEKTRTPCECQSECRPFRDWRISPTNSHVSVDAVQP